MGRQRLSGQVQVAVAVNVHVQVHVQDNAYVNDHAIRTAVPSASPDRTRGKKEEGEEVPSELFEAHGDTPKPLDALEEVSIRCRSL